MKELLFLNPVFKEMIWGGNRMREEYGYDIPGDDTGECWAISAHPNGDCVVENGTYAGKKLSELWSEQRELFGNYDSDRYPLLIKIIDAKADLSIQVHPDDDYAKVHENGSLGKTECWYILDCDDDATIVIGHHAKDHEEMEQMIREQRWKEFIREIPIKKDDFFQINPGCLHAIKGGTLILETQQNSDITYRVYDYDRLSNGKPRELHVQQSIDTIKTPFEANISDIQVTKEDQVTKAHFVTCPYYSVEKYDISGSWSHEFKGYFTNVSVLDGEGSLNGISLKKGQHFIIPNGYGECKFEGNLSVICSEP
ncbi:MAG: class I mannose-6-phosphate isomerase [Clostridiales bacterium]|nr:class I mannose-6-phosphate isomerase [Clostridiales bacterium]